MIDSYRDNNELPYKSVSESKANTRVLKSKAAFEAANKEISNILEQNGSVSLDEMTEQFNIYENACDLIEKHFPGAKPSKDILHLADNVLKSHGVTGENTLFAQSVCPDEINHEQGDITNLFTEYLGEVFHLGGLAGIPFTGKTGFTAFSHHIPDDGNLFILLAPHIGLSKSLQLGKYSRVGQTEEGYACGAAVCALNYCLECKPIPPVEADPFDYQMNFLISEVHKRIDRIKIKKTKNEIQSELVKQMYEISKEFLDKIVHLDFGTVNPSLILLGGIQINCPPPLSDFFQPLMFEIRTKSGTGETLDLMHAFNSKSSELRIIESPIIADGCGPCHIN